MATVFHTFPFSHLWLTRRMEEIIAAIDRVIESDKNLSDASASRLAVGHSAFIKNLKKSRPDKQRIGTIEGLYKLAAVLGLEFYFGPPRSFQPSDAKPLFFGLGDIKPASFEHAPAEVRDKHFLPIPFSTKPLMRAEQGAGPIAFSMSWFDELGFAPDNLRFVRISGEGIHQLIAPGILVMINEADTVPESKAIYAYSRQGVLDVAELLAVKDSKGFILSRRSMSEAPEFLTSAQLKTEIRVLGRVVWFEGYSEFTVKE